MTDSDGWNCSISTSIKKKDSFILFVMAFVRDIILAFVKQVSLGFFTTCKFPVLFPNSDSL